MANTKSRVEKKQKTPKGKDQGKRELVEALSVLIAVVFGFVDEIIVVVAVEIIGLDILTFDDI